MNNELHNLQMVSLCLIWWKEIIILNQKVAKEVIGFIFKELSVIWFL